MNNDSHLPFLMAKTKRKVSTMKGKRVVFTEIRGQSRTTYKGILTGVFDRVGTITLDEDLHNYDTHAFNYTHLFLGEGTLRPWNKEADKDYLLLQHKENTY